MSDQINALPINTEKVDIDQIRSDAEIATEAKEDAQTAAGTKYREATWSALSAVSGLAGEGGACS